MSGPEAEDEVPARVFEALFQRSELPLHGAVLAELAAIGWTPDSPRSDYAARTWREAIEIARRHVCAELPVPEGQRLLGRRFAEGFGHTAVGRVFRSVAPLFGIERTLLSVPRYLHTVRKRMRVEVLAVSANHFRLLAWDQHPNPHFIAGCMEGILDIFHVEPAVSVGLLEAERFEIDVRWR